MRDSKATILIVDDSADSQQILTRILSSAGYQTVICVDGQEAINSIEANPPALVMLDLMMPRMSNFELLTRLRAKVLLREIPVIVMSAYLSAGFVLAKAYLLRGPGLTPPPLSFRLTSV